MIQNVKIFGERNTSTNALKALIEKNSQSRVAPSVAEEIRPFVMKILRKADAYKLPESARERVIDRIFKGRPEIETWKHALTNFSTPEAFAGTHVIFCVRHPLSWVLGLYRHPYHIDGTTGINLPDFLNKRWTTVARERLEQKDVSATQLYNIKLASFLEFQSKLTAAGMPFSVVRQEDFAMDQERVFARLAPHLTAPSAQFESLKASTKESSKDSAYYKDYYGNERWREDLDPQSTARIVAEIDWSLAESLQYAP